VTDQTRSGTLSARTLARAVHRDEQHRRLPIWLTGILFVLVLPGLAILVQLAIRRRWPVLADGEHNDVAGFIIAVVGVIYAGPPAFVVIVSWENFSQAESTVGQEASALRSIYRESQAFPPDVRARIR